MKEFILKPNCDKTGWFTVMEDSDLDDNFIWICAEFVRDYVKERTNRVKLQVSKSPFKGSKTAHRVYGFVKVGESVEQLGDITSERLRTFLGKSTRFYFKLTPL